MSEHQIIETLLVDSPFFHQKKLTIPPGAQTLRHFHGHTLETYVVISGNCEIETNGECYRPSLGDFFEIKPEQIHRITNIGLFTAVVISTKSGSSDIKDMKPV